MFTCLASVAFTYIAVFACSYFVSSSDVVPVDSSSSSSLQLEEVGFGLWSVTRPYSAGTFAVVDVDTGDAAYVEGSTSFYCSTYPLNFQLDAAFTVSRALGTLSVILAVPVTIAVCVMGCLPGTSTKNNESDVLLYYYACAVSCAAIGAFMGATLCALTSSYCYGDDHSNCELGSAGICAAVAALLWWVTASIILVIVPKKTAKGVVQPQKQEEQQKQQQQPPSIEEAESVTADVPSGGPVIDAGNS